MIIEDIRAKAQHIGVKNHSRLGKTDLIRAIQGKEGNTLVIPAQATRQAVNTSEADLEVLVIRSLVRPPEKSLMEIMGKM